MLDGIAGRDFAVLRRLQVVSKGVTVVPSGLPGTR